MSGQLVYKEKLNTDSQTIDVSHFENGMYIVYIVIDGENYSEKIIKK